MLDVFADYFMNLLSLKQTPTPEDENAVLSIGTMVLQILSNRACHQDFHLRLYIFRALAIICKIHPGFRNEKVPDIVE